MIQDVYCCGYYFPSGSTLCRCLCAQLYVFATTQVRYGMNWYSKSFIKTGMVETGAAGNRNR